ncbi:MAG: stage II sporulation protein M [Pseudomonadota bacterium]
MAEPVGDNGLKSALFRREREATWKKLQDLLARIERNGIKSASAQELHDLPILYRATMSSLSVARSISLDRNLLQYLESLAARGYFCVYGARATFAETLKAFVFVDLPEAVRAARWFIALSAGLFFLGTALGWLLVALESDWFYSLVDPGMAAGRDPDASRAELRETITDDGGGLTDMLIAFASFLFTHNAKVALACFAFGFAFGIPVVYLLFTNGLILGAFCAVFAGRGLGVDFIAWLLIHGSTELAAIILSGAAGFLLGQAIGFPGRLKRRAALAVKGRQAAIIALGAVGMLFVAALLEGLGRQLITDTAWRLSIATVALAFWIAYFAFSGRQGR